MNNVLVLPTRRFCMMLGLAGVLFIFSPILGSWLLKAGLGYIAVLCVLLVSDSLRLRAFGTSKISREVSVALSVGIRNKIRIVVENRAPFAVDIHFRDSIPAEFEVYPQHHIARFPAEAAAQTEYEVVPPQRGNYRLGNIHFRAYTTLGLAALQANVDADDEVRVYPDLSVVRKHSLLSRTQRTREMGLRVGNLIGRGREFDSLRDYQPDDEIRTIDWKATARRAKLTTREFDVERSQTVMLLLDMGRTMATQTVDADGEIGPTKADLAVNAALMLSSIASGWDDRVGISCFAESVISYVPPGKGHAQSSLIMDDLYMRQPRMEESNYRNALLYFDQKQRKRSLVFVFTDLIDPDSSARLIKSIGIISKHHLTVCVALSDYELEEIIEAGPSDTDTVFRQAVALNIRRDRRSALAALSATGAIVLDAAPADLTIETVNKYLALKREGRV